MHYCKGNITYNFLAQFNSLPQWRSNFPDLNAVFSNCWWGAGTPLRYPELDRFRSKTEAVLELLWRVARWQHLAGKLIMERCKIFSFIFNKEIMCLCHPLVAKRNQTNSYYLLLMLRIYNVLIESLGVLLQVQWKPQGKFLGRKNLHGLV